MTEGAPSVTRRQFLATVGVAAAATGGRVQSRPFCHGVTVRRLPDGDEAITFSEDGGAAETFTSVHHEGHNSYVRPCGDGRDEVLRVGMPAGNHYGTSLGYEFAELGVDEPTALAAQYYVYFPQDFVVRGTGGKLPGPAGTYGRGGWGGRPSNGSNGWSARGLFEPSGDPDRPIQLSYYTYHADMDTRFGDTFAWDVGTGGRLSLGRWHRIGQWIELNAPGENDGVLRGWVDGELAMEKTDVRFRDTADLKIQEYWFNVYYGGDEPSPSDNAIYFDTLSLSWDRDGG